MVQLLLQIGLPRTGTTNLVRVLDSFANVLPAGELFHPDGVYCDGSRYSERMTADLLGRVFVGTPPPNGLFTAPTRAFVAADPLRTLRLFQAFAAAYAKSIFSFKVFPGHLRYYQILEIIDRLQPAILFVHREPVDVFISERKAALVGNWSAVDTSNLTLDITADDFIAWYRERNRFLVLAHAAAQRRRVPFTSLTYREMYDPATTPQAAVCRKLETLGLVPGAAGEVTALPRQDRSTSRHAKVRNWTAFEDEIARRGFAHCLDAFHPTDGVTDVQIRIEALRSRVGKPWRAVRRIVRDAAPSTRRQEVRSE